MIGFIGLGKIGTPIAARIARAGYAMRVFDIAGAAGRTPDGAEFATSVTDVARSDIVLICLPSVQAVTEVVEELAASPALPDCVVDTSTIGPGAAQAAHACLQAKGIGYVDGPVSGGVARAELGTLTTIYAGSAETLTRLRPILQSYSSNIFHVGSGPGQGQAMKLLNNYASIACMLATSEAIAFGMGQGLEMKTMLDVLNASSGRSFASDTHFANHIMPGRFDSGAAARIVGKDLTLFIEAARAGHSSRQIGEAAFALYSRFAAGDAEQDWLRVYEFVRSS